MSAHGQVVDLLAGYALGAASVEEAGIIRAHLPECGECRADLARLSEAASALALTVEEVPPPARLRQSIKSAVAGEGGPMAASQRAARSGRIRDGGLERATAELIQLTRPARRPGIMSRLRSPWVPAAAAAVIMAGLLAWNVRLQTELGTRPAAVASAGIVTAPLRGAQGSNFGTVTFLRGQKVALVGLRNLASPPGSRTYELWVIDAKGKPRPAGVFLPDADGTKLLIVPQDVNGDTLAVTEEPLGGSALPTTAPFVTGSV